jgi:hypothetical protein
MILAAMAAAIFLFTSAVFIAYDSRCPSAAKGHGECSTKQRDRIFTLP